MNTKAEQNLEILTLQQKKIDTMQSCQEPYQVEVFGKPILVLPGVFSPATDTKLLISTATISPHERVLEPFSGTGVISVFLAQYAREIIATDINPEAVRNIEDNIQLHGLEKKMKALQADIFPPSEETFDVITINPPYTDREAKNLSEKSMWDKDHAAVRRFFRESKNYLTPQGRIYSTWANFAGFDFIEELAQKEGYSIAPISEAVKDMKVYRVYEIRPGKPIKGTE